MAAISDYLKNIFWILLLIQVAPPIIKAIKKQYTDLLEPKTKVGVITLKGTLYSADSYVKSFKSFFENDSIKAILLKIDCPGGAAGTSQAIFNELKIRKQEYNKPVVAVIENIAASGGYYVACAADHIIATSSAFVGSIGVYVAHPYFKDFIEQYKIKYEIIKAGKYKTVGNPFAELNPQDRELLEGLTKNVYEQFVSDVRQQRPGVPADTNVWAEGKIFTGQQALQLKLIDEIGSSSTATNALRAQAHIEGEIDWVFPSKDRSWITNIFYPDESNSEQHALSKILTGFIQLVTEQFKLYSSC